jgi:hypothetical protein
VRASAGLRSVIGDPIRPGQWQYTTGGLTGGCPVSFTLAASLPGVAFATTSWADIDRDGDLDLLASGQAGGQPTTTLYINTAGSFAPSAIAGLPSVKDARMAWGDYNNDGFPDLLLAGDTGASAISRVYRNNRNGTFTDIPAGLAGTYAGAVSWVDFDNDGYLDVFVTGHAPLVSGGYTSQLYRNTGLGGFTAITTGLPAADNSEAAWIDLEGDGDMDLFLAGSQGYPNVFARIYRNDGRLSATAWTFTDINAGLPGIFAGSAAWADYDGDGDPDLAMTGQRYSPSGEYTYVYVNQGAGGFALAQGLTGTSNSQIAWGDYDNDGDPDLAVGGAGALAATYLYRNDPGSGGARTLVSANPGVIGLTREALAWGDFDGDGDLDLAIAGNDQSLAATARVYANNGCASLALSMSGAPDPVLAGAPLTYVVSLRNIGNSPAVLAPLTATLPLSASAAACQISAGACAASGSIVTR